MSINPRLGCSTISFRHLPLRDALAVIDELQFAEIDLGALPGVCDHVPVPLDRPAVDEVAAAVSETPLLVRSVNGDIGDLNLPLDAPEAARRSDHLDRLLDLTAAVGAPALVLPNGHLSHEPVDDLSTDIARVAGQLGWAADRAAARDLEIWVESLHLFRLCSDIDRAQQLTDSLPATVGVVMDFSHVVASGATPQDFVARFGPRIRHVHCRDATPGNIHHSIGNGDVDFAGGLHALETIDYAGHLTLELETRDIGNDERPAATAKAAAFISSLL